MRNDNGIGGLEDPLQLRHHLLLCRPIHDALSGWQRPPTFGGAAGCDLPSVERKLFERRSLCALPPAFGMHRSRS